MGKTLDEADQEERPLGVVGLRNLGELLFLTYPLDAVRLCSLGDRTPPTPSCCFIPADQCFASSPVYCCCGMSPSLLLKVAGCCI